MKKNEFLNELRKKLSGLSKEDLENRVNFYSEMIDDRIDEGKSEEEAVAEIGTVDEVVYEIAKDTPLVAIVKEKIKPKRSLRAWEIVLLVLGFPLWFPLVVTALVLALVFYLLVWVLVVVTYATELSLVGASLWGATSFAYNLYHGDINLFSLAISVMAAGGALLLFFGCVGSTKLSIKLSKSIITGIKATFIKKGGNK